MTLNWNNNPMAQGWTVEYGYTGFTQGQGTSVDCNTNSYVVTGLLDGYTYDFHVKAVCGTDWNSENWASTSATTEYAGVTCGTPTGVSATVADNSVTVKGVGLADVNIVFGEAGGANYDELLSIGAFDAFAHQYIFKKDDKGMLA